MVDGKFKRSKIPFLLTFFVSTYQLHSTYGIYTLYLLHEIGETTLTFVKNFAYPQSSANLGLRRTFFWKFQI